MRSGRMISRLNVSVKFRCARHHAQVPSISAQPSFSRPITQSCSIMLGGWWDTPQFVTKDYHGVVSISGKLSLLNQCSSRHSVYFFLLIFSVFSQFHAVSASAQDQWRHCQQQKTGEWRGHPRGLHLRKGLHTKWDMIDLFNQRCPDFNRCWLYWEWEI